VEIHPARDSSRAPRRQDQGTIMDLAADTAAATHLGCFAHGEEPPLITIIHRQPGDPIWFNEW
jgi:hypothetical protein